MNGDGNDACGIALIGFFDANGLCMLPAPNFLMLQDLLSFGESWVKGEIDLIPSNDISVRLVGRPYCAAFQKPKMSDVVCWLVAAGYTQRWLTRSRECCGLGENRVKDHFCAFFGLAPHSKVTTKLLPQTGAPAMGCGYRQAHSGGCKRIRGAANAPPKCSLRERASSGSPQEPPTR